MLSDSLQQVPSSKGTGSLITSAIRSFYQKGPQFENFVRILVLSQRTCYKQEPGDQNFIFIFCD